MFAAPAFAAECPYLNNAGDRVLFGQGVEDSVSIVRADGSKTVCSIGADAPGEVMWCKDGSKGVFSFAPAKWHGTDQSLMIWSDDVWYRVCSTGV